jgi:HK97 gp10 family phage protein
MSSAFAPRGGDGFRRRASASYQAGDPVILLALGRGKAAKKMFSLAPLDDVVAELKKLPADISNKYQRRALKKAAKPGKAALEANVRAIGQVTGNLLASITEKGKSYTNNKFRVPVSVYVIGFRRPVGGGSQRTAETAFGGSVMKGPNRAYHSHLVEFGTKGRRTPGKSRVVKRRRVILDGRIITQRERRKEQPDNNPRQVLSSWNYRRGKGSWQGKYPIDFIATGSVAPMPALRPLERAFNQSRGAMKSILDVEMRKSLSAALRAYERRNKAGDK